MGNYWKVWFSRENELLLVEMKMLFFFPPQTSENMKNKLKETLIPHQYLTRNVFTNFSYSIAISAVILPDTLILSNTAIKVTGTVNVYDDMGHTLGIQWHFAAPVRNAAVFFGRPEGVNFPSPSGG